MMEPDFKIKNPNSNHTVGGLISLKRELLAEIEVAKRKLDKLSKNLIAVDHVLDVLGCSKQSAAVKPKSKHHFILKYGEISKNITRFLKEAGGLHTDEIVERFISEFNLIEKSGSSFDQIKKRIYEALRRQRELKRITSVADADQQIKWIWMDPRWSPNASEHGDGVANSRAT